MSASTADALSIMAPALSIMAPAPAGMAPAPADMALMPADTAPARSIVLSVSACIALKSACVLAEVWSGNCVGAFSTRLSSSWRGRVGCVDVPMAAFTKESQGTRATFASDAAAAAEVA